jgi:uncharacterized protein (UPF0332 family)
VKPETAVFLNRAKECLADAARALPIVPRMAAREAYLAAFQAAQAVIFERTSRVSKTHRGVRAQFARLTQDEPAVGRQMMIFLTRGYEIKAWADYGDGPEGYVIPITPTEAVDAATHFIKVISDLLA